MLIIPPIIATHIKKCNNQGTSAHDTNIIFGDTALVTTLTFRFGPSVGEGIFSALIVRLG